VKRAGPATRIVALVLLIGSALAGLARLPHELSAQSDAAAAGRAIPRIESVPVLSGRTRQTEFLAMVRRTVPARDPVRIVQAVTPVSPLEERAAGDPGICGYSASRLQYFWIVYALSPRPATCDPQAVWTVYYGVPPAQVPAGATVFAAGYALARR
jgi:hypothetical protein